MTTGRLIFSALAVGAAAACALDYVVNHESPGYQPRAVNVISVDPCSQEFYHFSRGNVCMVRLWPVDGNALVPVSCELIEQCREGK